MKSDWLNRAIFLRNRVIGGPGFVDQVFVDQGFGHRARRSSWPLIALLLIAITPTPTPATADDAANARLERVFVDSRIQRELPPAPAPSATGTQRDAGSGTRVPERSDAPASRSPGDPTAQSSSPPQPRSPIGDPSPALKVLLWILVGALAIIVFFHISQALIKKAKTVGKSKQAPGNRTPVEQTRSPMPAPRTLPPNPLAAAEDLAGTGNYGEAIHLVLLIAIERLRERFGRIGPSLTSLEVSRELPLDGDAKPALATLVALVELSHFGGRPLGEPDYRRAKSRFADLIAVVGPSS